MLGVAFVSSGVEALREPDRRAERARQLGVPEPQQATRAVAAAQVAAGVLLLINRLPRLSALVLALTVVPEAATGHPFWAEKDKQERASARALFVRDLGLLGGLLTAVADTGGRESVPHRAARTARKAGRRTAKKAAALT